MTVIRVHEFSEAGAYDTFPDGPLVPPPPSTLQRDGADLHLAVERDQGLAARCSLWWSRVPSLGAARVGYIGHYAAADDRAAEMLLEHACRQLAHHRCAVAVGPVNGSTWREYRFVVERGGEPPFFLEPNNPDEWATQFVRCGFTILARYTSALTEALDRVDDRVQAAGDRLTAAGVRVRAFDRDKSEADLGSIYDVSGDSFSRNFLYTPICKDEFMSHYRPILHDIDASLVMLAEHEERPVGFLFALPDLLRPPGPGSVRDTFIIKTVAVRHERALGGLGTVLVARAHAVARALGYRRAIHALMHERNVSRNISARYARTIRRYALFARRLSP